MQKKIPEYPLYFRFPGIELGISLGPYAFPLREAVSEFKFNQKKALASILTNFLADRIKVASWRLDCVIPVPMALNRRSERGYNQAKVLAEGMASHLKVPCFDLLFVSRFLAHQVSLGKKERRQNVRGAFSLKTNHRINEKSVLLVDDVVTTGATLQECAKILRGGGARKVYGACIALQRMGKE